MRPTRIAYLLLITSVVSFAVSSCKKDNSVDFHYDYFGLEQGRFVIYDVLEMVHDDALGQHDTLSYQLKTYWADTIMDNEGRIAREFWRYKRDSDTMPWVLTDVWTGIIDGGVRGELIEENQRVVKLIFAPTLQKSWDANAYNMFPALDCYYRDINRDTIVGGIPFDSTLVVEQETFYSLIDSVRKYEVYGNNVGLIYRHFRDLHYQQNQGQFFLDQGTEAYYTFVSTGFE